MQARVTVPRCQVGALNAVRTGGCEHVRPPDPLSRFEEGIDQVSLVARLAHRVLRSPIADLRVRPGIAETD